LISSLIRLKKNYFIKNLIPNSQLYSYAIKFIKDQTNGKLDEIDIYLNNLLEAVEDAIIR
jgi:hypothetical protein